jgi:hypothetical protein
MVGSVAAVKGKVINRCRGGQRPDVSVGRGRRGFGSTAAAAAAAVADLSVASDGDARGVYRVGKR